jgi:hypothetical protein
MAQYKNLEWQYPGLSDVGSYQMGGIPFATGNVPVAAVGASTTQIAFPNVTKFVTVVNETTGTNAQMRVGFSSNGVKGTNYFLLDNGESYTGEWRLTNIYLMGNSAVAPTASVVAGVTNIPVSELAANWSGSTGVG